MGVGVYELDAPGGGVGAASRGYGGSGWKSPISRPVVTPMRPVNPGRAYSRVGGRAVTPNSGARNLNGFNNRSTSPNGYSQPINPKPTAARPFSPAPSRSTGGGRSGFADLLRGRPAPARALQGGQGFGPQQAKPLSRPAPRPIPIDTPTGGAKRPFNFRRPLGNIPLGSLPNNPFAAAPTPFEASGAGDLPAITYPGQIPGGAISPGQVILPAVPPPFSGGQSAGISYTAFLAGKAYGSNATADRPGTGPISGVAFQNNGFGNWGIGIAASNGLQTGGGGTASCGSDERSTWKIINIVRDDGKSDTGGDPAGGVPQQLIPNPLRPATPQPLFPTAPTPAPTPARPYENPPQPAKQPLPYISPAPVPLQPGEAPLPEELQPTELPEIGKIDQPYINKSPKPGKNFSPQPSFEAGVRAGVSLANSAQSAINSRQAEEIKRLILTGVELGQGQLIPPYTPVTGLTGSSLTIPRIIITTTPPPNAPPETVDKCCPIDIPLARATEPITDTLDELRNRLEDCLTPDEVVVNVPTVTCETVNNSQVATTSDQLATNIADALHLLALEVASIRLQLDPCEAGPIDQVAPYVIASGLMTAAETVAYVATPVATRQVELIITGTIPNDLRLYDTTQSGEQQGKFGSLVAAYPGVTGGHASEGFHQWSWTRRTSLYVGKPIRADREIRVYLRAGLSWVLYDTGLRN